MFLEVMSEVMSEAQNNDFDAKKKELIMLGRLGLFRRVKDRRSGYTLWTVVRCTVDIGTLWLLLSNPELTLSLAKECKLALS